jgi:iron complex outermembrane receptor protein
MNKIILSRKIVIACLVLSQTTALWATGDDAFQFFQEEAKVVSASRIPQSRSLAAATTYVVTSDEIKASGAQNIPDALRNVPGVDVMQTRTDQAEVSIRGLNHPLNNRTLILLDGKTVLDGFFDFIIWESIPVTMDEIDRIEVVEGPASAVYGANAVNGVINIITKTPEQLQGGQLSYSAGTRNQQLGSYVYGKQTEQLGYRMAGGWNSMNQFQDADQFASQAGKFNGLLDYKFSDQSGMSVSGGVTSLNTQTTTGVTGTAYDKGIVSFARTDYHYGDTRFKAFWNHGRTNFDEFQFPPNSNLDYDTYDAEIERSISLPFRNQMVLGSSYRRNTARGDALSPGLLAQDLWSAFLEDQWSIKDRCQRSRRSPPFYPHHVFSSRKPDLQPGSATSVSVVGGHGLSQPHHRGKLF